MPLWIVQGLLALLFLFAGGMKLVQPVEVLTAQMPLPPLPGLFVRFIGVAEVLGAIGLILPGLLRIRPAGPDAAGRRRAGDHHDRCDDHHAGGRRDDVPASVNL